MTGVATIIPGIFELSGIARGKTGRVGTEEKSVIPARGAIWSRGSDIEHACLAVELNGTHLAFPCNCIRIETSGTDTPAHLQEKIRSR